MRNLKRALSLALASVMLLGMMVVGTSAASYPDVDSKDNLEAIEVLKAVGVMTGDDKGNFNPDQNVTRNEMAVVMANLLDLKVDDFSAASIKFTDVPAWAAKYVAACKADGIIAGYSETVFGGSDTVTAAQAALMMQKALGYFQFQADFGDDWQLATVKQASKINLFDGINAGAGTALTRNEVAQLALNALEATMVEADGNGGTTISGNGFVITTGSTKYVDVLKTGNKYDAIDDAKSENKSIVQLGEELFDGDLEKDPAKTDFGAPAHKWIMDSEDVIIVADEADKVVVAKEDYDTAADAYADLVDEDFEGTIATKINNETSTAIKKGDIISFYDEVDDNKSDDPTNAYVVRYDIGKITKIDTKVSKADKEDGVAAYVTLKTLDEKSTVGVIDDVDFIGYNAEYVKDAVVLYVKSGSKVIASELADCVEGKVTALKGEKAAIDGSYVETATKVELGAEGTFYLNAAGQIMAFDAEVTKSDDYAYIYKVVEDGDTNSDGFTSEVFTAYMVLADGTKASYVIDDDETALKNESYKGVVAYSINSDGELETKTGADDVADAAVNATVDKDNVKVGSLFTNSKTQFIFAYQDGSKMKVSTAVGYKNVKIANTADIWTVSDDGDVLYAFVTAKNGTLDSDELLAVLLNTTAVVTEDDDNTYYTYEVAVDGEPDELTLKNQQISGLKKGDVFSYKMDGEYVKKDSVSAAKTVYTVQADTEDYVYINDTRYELGTETVYTITVDYKKDGTTIDSVSVSEGGVIEKDAKVVYTEDDGDLDVVFVIDEIK